MQSIFTDRLVLRDWLAEDVAPFSVINQDPQVMEFFPNILSVEETRVFISKIRAHLKQHGFGLYACALRETNALIGFVGLSIPTFDSHFTPCVEIGWRLSSSHWDQGFATEAAQTVLKIGFEQFNLKEIVSFTVPQNLRSRHVMEKLGMKHDEADDFNHPNLSLTHPLSMHVLYRLQKTDWLQKSEFSDLPSA